MLQDNMVRVNTRLSKSANKWLDDYSRENGIPKSTLILLAVENYREQKEAIHAFGDMSALIAKLESIEAMMDKGRRGIDE